MGAFLISTLSFPSLLVYRAITNSEIFIVYLAPRALYFGDRQLFWECRGSKACESFPMSFDNDSATTPGTLVDVGLNEDGWRMRRWFDIIHTYSNCQLTYSGDKLVAISGLARIFASRTRRDEYLAGLWSTDLEKQLCWLVTDNGGGCRPSEYRGPSWSVGITVSLTAPFSFDLSCTPFSSFQPFHRFQFMSLPSIHDDFPIWKVLISSQMVGFDRRASLVIA